MSLYFRYILNVITTYYEKPHIYIMFKHFDVKMAKKKFV